MDGFKETIFRAVPLGRDCFIDGRRYRKTSMFGELLGFLNAIESERGTACHINPSQTVYMYMETERPCGFVAR